MANENLYRDNFSAQRSLSNSFAHYDQMGFGGDEQIILPAGLEKGWVAMYRHWAF